MTTLPLQPEYPDEAGNLDKWLGPRRQQEPGAIGRLKPEDAEGQGGAWATRTEQAQRVRRAAVLIGLLWGVEYEQAGPGIKSTMRQTGRQVILECGNSLEAVEQLYREMDADPTWREPCHKCQSAYSVAGRMKAYYTVKQQAKSKSVDYLNGMTMAEWEEERAENARIRAEWLARKTSTGSDGAAK